MSIAKAGIITTLNARTSILAAANPVRSKYQLNLPITRIIDLQPTLISRFDLLYTVLDQMDKVADIRLAWAKHLVGLYLEDAPVTGGGEDILVGHLHRDTGIINWLTGALLFSLCKNCPLISTTLALVSNPSSPKKPGTNLSNPTSRCGTWATTLGPARNEPQR